MLGSTESRLCLCAPVKPDGTGGKAFPKLVSLELVSRLLGLDLGACRKSGPFFFFSGAWEASPTLWSSQVRSKSIHMVLMQVLACFELVPTSVPPSAHRS